MLSQITHIVSVNEYYRHIVKSLNSVECTLEAQFLMVGTVLIGKYIVQRGGNYPMSPFR